MTAVMSPTTARFGPGGFGHHHQSGTHHHQHPFRDRTQELHSIFNIYRQSSATTTNSAVAIGAAVKNEQQQNANSTSNNKKSSIQQQSQEVRQFNDAASRFSLDLSGLAETVGNLTRLTQGHGGVSGSDAFDQNSQEITRLTQLVKSRLGNLHDDLNDLADMKEAASSSSSAMSKHNNAVLAALRSKLVGTGNNFRHVMQRRTQVMKDASSRRSKLLADRPSAAAASSSSTNFDDENNNNNEKSNLLGGDHATSTALMQQNRNTNYLRDRQQAVHEIEVAVREVGEIVQDFTRLVYEQDETIVRIDNDVDEALDNVTAGSGELMKYLASLNSQRGFILKVLGVLFCFLLFFGFFVVR